jgi:hypothetical protein
VDYTKVVVWFSLSPLWEEEHAMLRYVAKVPALFCIEQGWAIQVADNEELECHRLIGAVNALDRHGAGQELSALDRYALRATTTSTNSRKG